MKSGYRNRLFKGVHAEALKRKLDHDALHDLCAHEYGVKSMGDMSDAQLLGLYRQWTGHGLKRVGKLPTRGEAAGGGVAVMISGTDLETLAAEFAKRGMGEEGRANFIARQLRGRRVIRSRSDFAKVLNGVRAMNRRDEKKPKESV